MSAGIGECNRPEQGDERHDRYNPDMPPNHPSALPRSLRFAKSLIHAGAMKSDIQFSVVAIVRQHLDFYAQLLGEHRRG